MKILAFFKRNAANCMSMANLGFGILSLFFAFKGLFANACIMILLSVLFDGFDGRVARYFKCESELGKNLDSLCDLVGFGVAPGMLLYFFTYPLLREAGIVITLIFVFCGAFRLARFNVLNIHDYYVGIPITLAGMIVGILGFFGTLIPAVVWIVLALLLSYLMICTLKVKKL